MNTEANAISKLSFPSANLAKSINVNMQEVNDVAMMKKAKNGGFDKKYYLEKTMKRKK